MGKSGLPLESFRCGEFVADCRRINRLDLYPEWFEEGEA